METLPGSKDGRLRVRKVVILAAIISDDKGPIVRFEYENAPEVRSGDELSINLRTGALTITVHPKSSTKRKSKARAK